MARFGLSGYQCDITKTEDGVHLVAWSGVNPQLSVAKDVKQKDFPYKDRGIEDRAQTEALFAPLFDELEAKYHEQLADSRKTRAEDAKKSAAQAREHRKGVRENPTGEVAKDGSVGSNPLPQNP